VFKIASSAVHVLSLKKKQVKLIFKKMPCNQQTAFCFMLFYAQLRLPAVRAQTKH